MELPEELPSNLPEYVKSWVIKRTGNRKYECKLCHMEIVNTEMMRLHLRNWYHIKKVMQQTALHCDLCNLQFKFQSAYDKHINTKSHVQKENPQPAIEHKCEDCAVKFSCRKQMEIHLATKKHINQTKSFNCDLCAMKFGYQSVYDAHIKTKRHLQKENPQPKPIIEHKCEDCSVTFQSNKDKLRHLTTKKHAKLAKTDSVSSTV
jgi:uncharacterized C2H2 Zn-finger protein